MAYKCKICAKEFELRANEHYVSIDNSKIGLSILAGEEPGLYDTFDCPYCGCQNVVGQRKRKYFPEELDEKEELIRENEEAVEDDDDDEIEPDESLGSKVEVFCEYSDEEDCPKCFGDFYNEDTEGCGSCDCFADCLEKSDEVKVKKKPKRKRPKRKELNRCFGNYEACCEETSCEYKSSCRERTI